MEKLKLPVFKNGLPPRRPLSMDDYLKFVIFNLKYVVKNKPNKKLRRSQLLNVPFVIQT